MKIFKKNPYDISDIAKIKIYKDALDYLRKNDVDIITAILATSSLTLSKSEIKLVFRKHLKKYKPFCKRWSSKWYNDHGTMLGIFIFAIDELHNNQKKIYFYTQALTHFKYSNELDKSLLEVLSKSSEINPNYIKRFFPELKKYKPIFCCYKNNYYKTPEYYINILEQILLNL